MKHECGLQFGAAIERGRVVSVENGGYEVASLERDGIVSPAIPAAGGAEYAAGDDVLFCLFRDGTGAILCGA